MRRHCICFVFMLVLLLSACSYTSSFVVLNESEMPVKVRYRIKRFDAEPLRLTGEPAKTEEANLRNRDRQWRLLKSGEYLLELEARTVTVEVSPREALRVLYITNYGGHDDVSDAGKFQIDEITINGARGEIKFQGDEIRRKFVEESESLYVLSYK
jgi:hypothetical protein